jgi:hypothetical protein
METSKDCPPIGTAAFTWSGHVHMPARLRCGHVLFCLCMLCCTIARCCNSYVLFCLYMLLNMFLAILNDSYAEVTPGHGPLQHTAARTKAHAHTHPRTRTRTHMHTIVCVRVCVRACVRAGGGTSSGEAIAYAKAVKRIGRFRVRYRTRAPMHGRPIIRHTPHPHASRR